MNRVINRENKQRKTALEDFIVEIDGKSFVTFSGLLNLAHETGLFSITTELIQVPSAVNGNMAIVKASVVTIAGTYTDFGDASPESVGEKFIPHIIRYASTRAKARVLRDALNIGFPAIEELVPSETTKKETPKIEYEPKPITARQLEALHQMAKLLNLPEEEVESMKSLDRLGASDKIQELNRRLQIEKSRNCSQQSTAHDDFH